MKKFLTFFPVTLVALALFALPTLARADIVLNVDLSVVNQVTIAATSAASTSTVSGSEVTGFYLENFYTGDPAATNLVDTYVSGFLTSFLNASNANPADLFNSNFFPPSYGLNVFSYTDDPTSDFVAGTQAFSGSGTWSLDAASYADMLAGNTSGDVWAFADGDDDIPSGGGTAVLIGQYRVGAAVPEPTSLALFALGTVGLAFRRRRA